MGAKDGGGQHRAGRGVTHGELEDEVEEQGVVLEDLVQRLALGRADEPRAHQLRPDGAAVTHRERLRLGADGTAAERGHGPVGAVDEPG